MADVDARACGITANGQWTWWRNDERTVVGWLSAETFAQADIPICTVGDARDAQLLVGVLDALNAEPVLS
jgi:hypothetical protein